MELLLLIKEHAFKNGIDTLLFSTVAVRNYSKQTNIKSHIGIHKNL